MMTAVWHVVAVFWSLSVLALLALLTWAALRPATDREREWEQHCDDALAVARDGYTDEALALADLALWEMEMPT